MANDQATKRAVIVTTRIEDAAGRIVTSEEQRPALAPKNTLQLISKLDLHVAKNALPPGFRSSVNGPLPSGRCSDR